jgi:hypothetical protein
VPLELDDLVHHLNADDNPPAAGSWRAREMQRALDTAVQEVTRATGMLDDRTVTVTRAAVRGSLSVPYVRLAAIGAVDAGGLPALGADADPLAGIVDGVGSGTYTVTCTGAPWPSALVTAALDWAAHLYDTQRAVVEPVDEDQPTPTYALPNRVEELLRPYRLPGAA